LPSGDTSTQASTPVTAPAAVTAPAPVPAPAPAPVSETPEQARAVKEGLDEFLKSHGANPEPPPSSETP